MNNFKDICTQCGLCCKLVGQFDNFPEETDENGCCIHLNDNKCSIYENRPLICRVDDYYETVKDRFKSKDEFIKLNIQVCNALISQAGIDKKYLIKQS